MNLDDAYKFLNFWIGKFTGAWYSMEELDLLVDRGQMGLFNDEKQKYATSQQVKDLLSPFKKTYNFVEADTPNGLITIPSNENYQHLLDITRVYTEDGQTRYSAVDLPNEDERTYRLKSQINSPSINEPIAEPQGKGIFQLWPRLASAGWVTFLRRPVKPFYKYTIVSGRVIVYDNAGSTQLEWQEGDQNAVLLKSLQSIGINLSEQDIQNWAEIKTQQNFNNVNRT